MGAKTHGEVKWVNGKRCPTPEYRAWQALRNRCTNVNSKDYPYYGGRGISFCARWGRYENFLADMGRRPSSQHTLDRKNTDGNYCKRNCRWATRKEQSRNRPYASTHAWILAERMGWSLNYVRHLLWQVRAKDRNAGTRFELSPALEKTIRKFTENYK